MEQQNKEKQIEILKKHEETSKKYRKKYIISRFFYIFISLIIMIISSLQIILNLFAIRWNNDLTLKTIFLFIAILAALIAFIQSIMLFFDFKTNKEENNIKLENLINLKNKYIEDPNSVKTSKLANEIYDISKDNN
ncbi:DUF4231 domain-containing protein [Metamycoplasma phocicerebrale]|uniref:DUF4231 domain-containing protein n=1 Tax=Metamycoplasma phocicerebrale TaxID=142649 RepID=A0A3T0TU15_9BACT|nr:DUF4231 domain-containing protein [Metamycoplasma phocicerebrale]AZZ65538.1 DUF4231 domain-containing protein [Metamycoplasma phocicerebrale]